MAERAGSGRRGLRLPTLGQWVGLVVAEGLVWLTGVVVGGYVDWPPLPWVTAAVMVLVLARWLLKLRSEDGSQWGGSGDGGYPTTITGYDGTGGGGLS
jgi:hypothetical protein